MKELKIIRMDDFGRGIGTIDGKIVFVRDALEGEIILCQIEKETKKYFIGKNKKILISSSKRKEPLCPFYEKCGGCQLQHMSYEETKKYKIEKIKTGLEKNHILFKTLDFVENKNDFYYRNKIELKLENGHLGFYQDKSHHLIEIDNCVITKKSINSIFSTLKQSGLKNAKIIVRSNYNDELLLAIDTQDAFDLEKLKKGNKIAGIVVNKKRVYNDSFFIEQIQDLYFKVSYDSFFQVNPYICQKLFALISKYIEKDMVVADLYCGVGTLSIVASKKAKKVYGIEIVEDAVLDAIKNAKINKRENIYFQLGRVDKLFPQIKDKIDLIIVDPPRAGLDKTTIQTILKYKPARIIYVSCNPSTLIRDLKELTKEYAINDIYLLDMFSYTYHAECVCVMSRR